MDFSLDYRDGQEEFAKEVRARIEENVPEDLVKVRDPLKVSYEHWQKRRELGRKLGEKGWHSRQEKGGKAKNTTS